MAAQAGHDLLLKIGDAASPEVFTAVGGGRVDSITFNEETIDVTNKASAARWRELLRGGLKSMSASTTGVFTDSASEASVRTEAFGSGAPSNFQVLIPDFGTFTGAFLISSLEYRGENGGAAEYSFTLESAGQITFATV
jgi:TP901-1 family phage major tail protein